MNKSINFFKQFEISFSFSPVGTILFHLLSLQNHELRTYAFFPDLELTCNTSNITSTNNIHSKNISNDNNSLKLLCIRKSICSVTHVSLGKRKRLIYEGFLETKLLNSNNEKNKKDDNLNSTQSSNHDDQILNLIVENHRYQALTNDMTDLMGTILLSTEVIIYLRYLLYIIYTVIKWIT
jgi:hypothetical protein